MNFHHASKRNKMILIGVSILVLLCGGGALVLSRLGNFSINLPLKHTAEFSPDPQIDWPQELAVQGNQLVNSQGAALRLRGVMIPDPAVLRGRGKFKASLFADIAGLGANVVRIPVHPENWVNDPDYLWRYLDPAVTWAAQNGLYVIIDWHYIGNVETGAGEQMPDLEQQPRALTDEFWTAVAAYFHAAPNVIFEIFNEPQSISAADWARNAGQIVATIRSQGAGQLVICGGVEYSKDLSWFVGHPLEDSNVAYAAHIYPSHGRSMWDHWFGDLVSEHPVLVSEWGFMQSSSSPETSYLVGSAEDYGQPLLDYMKEKSIGWVACWYDDDWLPPMFESGWKELNPYGRFIADALHGGE